MALAAERAEALPLLPWQQLAAFTASTTLHEKIFRLANPIILAIGSFCLLSLIGHVMTGLAPSLLFLGVSVVSITLSVRKIASVIIGYACYPAGLFDHRAGEQLQLNELRRRGFVTQRISLHKSGTTYDAFLVGHRDTIANQKWSLHALGNAMAMENVLLDYSLENHTLGLNTLFINGPSVGRSGGFPTRYQMGAGFEAGLQFLEQKVGATHIVCKGFSLGGGMIAEAFSEHAFPQQIDNPRYLVISDRSFNSLSDAATSIIGVFLKPIFFLAGMELDGVAGAERLRAHGIRHIIIQHRNPDHPDDGVIPDKTALAMHLQEAATRRFLLSPHILHNDVLPDQIWDELDQEIKNFLG